MNKILVFDFGGQYAHLITRRIRGLGVKAEIVSDPQNFKAEINPEVKGIILSGGPQSVYDNHAPQISPEIFELRLPILAICYGHQWVCQTLGGKVIGGDHKEYGKAEVKIVAENKLLKGIPKKSDFWMSHGDSVSELPEGFCIAAKSENCPTAAVFSAEKNIYGIQFHPEVTHSEYGEQVFSNFLEICETEKNWNMQEYLEQKSEEIRKKFEGKSVFLFVSGGVDSSVSFAFLTKILGSDRVRGFFVDTGMMRKGEVNFVEKSLKNIGVNLTTINASKKFLENLEGVSDPEKKREIIGNSFLEVQKEFFAENKLDDSWVLAQGTIYPDTIETGATKNSDKIKTHHNRVPEIEKLIKEGKVVEPLVELYKDEVRNLGRLLKLPDEMVDRHPFPGPGLGVRILCSDTQENKIFMPEVSAFTLQKKDPPFWVLPLKSVGVQGDARSYRNPGILKKFPEKKDISSLESFATKIINHYSEINRILFLLGKNFPENLKSVQKHKTFMTEDRIKLLQEIDFLVHENLKKQNLESKVWQFPVVLLPLSFNDQGKSSIVLRPVESIDAMSASVGRLPMSFFKEITQEILKFPEISAVFLDITSKPPGTIEWE